MDSNRFTDILYDQKYSFKLLNFTTTYRLQISSSYDFRVINAVSKLSINFVPDNPTYFRWEICKCLVASEFPVTIENRWFCN